MITFDFSFKTLVLWTRDLMNLKNTGVNYHVMNW